MAAYRSCLVFLVLAVLGLIGGASTAVAECATVSSDPDGLNLVNSGAFLRGGFNIRPTQAGYDVSLSVAGEKFPGASSARIILAPNQYAQLTFSVTAYGAAGEPESFDAGAFAAFFFPNRDLLLVSRSLEGDGTYTTMIVSKLMDVSEPQTECIVSPTAFDYESYVAQVLAGMTDATMAKVTDYSIPCVMTADFCPGPFIFSLLVYAPDVPVDSASAPELRVRAWQLTGQAKRTTRLDRAKGLLRQATELGTRFMSANPRISRRDAQRLRQGLRMSQRALRRTVPSREMRSALRNLHSALGGMG